jgi:hypothetical protein
LLTPPTTSPLPLTGFLNPKNKNIPANRQGQDNIKQNRKIKLKKYRYIKKEEQKRMKNLTPYCVMQIMGLLHCFTAGLNSFKRQGSPNFFFGFYFAISL